MARPAAATGLTSSEAAVLRHMAFGLTTRQIAERLVISPNTADHHIQHIYTNIRAPRGVRPLSSQWNHGILTSDVHPVTHPFGAPDVSSPTGRRAA